MPVLELDVGQLEARRVLGACDAVGRLKRKSRPGNAIAATAAGRRVTVSLNDNGGVAQLSVADEGSGISEAAQEDLFKPGRSSRPGGSGLGLAISQLLARQIGAELSLQSTGPLGTTFVVTLNFRG